MGNYKIIMINKIKYLSDIRKNILSNNKYQLSYVTEVADWSIKSDGIYITKNINSANLLKARITITRHGLRNQIIHFGSINTFVSEQEIKIVHPSNKIVLTWFHIVPNDPRIKFIQELNKKVEIVHTACNITKNKLIELGLNEEKIVVIPLGVEPSLFNPVTLEKKQKIKEELKIPLDKIVIGSFQKDGVGWSKGLEPKLIKGPNIFVKAVEKLAKDYPIFVLLVGPARGYVEVELKKRGIPFKSIGYLKRFEGVGKYYHALDLYLITSRIEGGPKQILETMASGIPVVSTKVGMVPDIIKDGQEALLTEIEDVDQIVNKAQKIIENEELKQKLVENGLKAVQKYSWEKIAKQYYEKIYKRFLNI